MIGTATGGRSDVLCLGAIPNLVSAYLVEGEPDDVLLAGRVIDVSADGVPIRSWSPPPNLAGIEQWLLGGISLHQPGTMWSKGLWSRCGPFPTGMRYLFDRFFFARAAMRAVRYVTVDFSVAQFRLHVKSKTESELTKFHSEWQAFRPSIAGDAPFLTRVRVRWLLFKEANWEVVRHTGDLLPKPALRCYLRRIAKNPAAVLHRPFFSGFVRTIFRGRTNL